LPQASPADHQGLQAEWELWAACLEWVAWRCKEDCRPPFATNVLSLDVVVFHAEATVVQIITPTFFSGNEVN
jgi:hypothetical protein